MINNEKALFEMDNAQKALSESFEHFQSVQRLIQSSRASFDEATAVSSNRDLPCHQAISAKIVDGYLGLTEAIAQFEQAFANPTLQRLITTAPSSSSDT
jgi:c-di-AMP phosphodiesterase-like protein